MKTLLKETAEYASGLLSRLPSEFMYHNLQHSSEVVEAAWDIGQNSGLSEEEVHLIQIAAWFHDTGFIEDYDTHEKVSINIAGEFLQKRNIPEHYINRVLDLIRITKPPLLPSSKMEEVIKDSDVLNIGTNDFFVKNILLKKEKEMVTKTPMSEKAWFDSTYNFILNTHFFTEYANDKYGEVRTKNIELLEEIALSKRSKTATG